VRQNLACDKNRAGLRTLQCSCQSARVWQCHRTRCQLWCDDAAKLELIVSCTVRSSPALFLSYTRFCRTCRQPLAEPQTPLVEPSAVGLVVTGASFSRSAWLTPLCYVTPKLHLIRFLVQLAVLQAHIRLTTSPQQVEVLYSGGVLALAMMRGA